MTTVAQALLDAHSLGVDRLDAQLLLARALGRSRAWILAHDEAPLDREQREILRARFARRGAGEPLAYLLGEKEFRGLTLRVTPDVLIPRPETETLVEWALECLAAGPAHAAALDLGTGSGAIALAVAHARPDASICAVDISATAIAVARSNGHRLGPHVEWLRSDWFSALGGRCFDLVLSNPPYVAEADKHLHALRFEPQSALRAGACGTVALRVVIAQAPSYLKPEGWLLLEHGRDQADAVRAMLRGAGFQYVSSRRDLSGQQRCSGGLRPA